VTEAELPPAPGSEKDIFLSHATPDKDTAYRLCRLIEEQGVRCWIAPRDVMPGDDYGESIIRAIEGTSVTVLLLSSHSNTSIHVRNEIERATSKRKRVIPVRLEGILPNRSLELHLSTAQWVDASRLGMDQVALQLVQAVRGELSKATIPSRVAPSSGTPSSHSSRLHIVPKGLRSFDAHDADFFLELLPGPRDREGLPDSIRFWKTRIEEPDADNTFAVGLIYGPSGCGKSSLVKAGLLPRLSDSVVPVYVEATAEETETRLLNGLRKRSPNLSPNLNLKETLAALRRGQGVPAGKKVLIVLDQFEQWLHARRDEQGTELVDALRQCDGSRVQCVVMVRDDFWMAATRFMRELEIRLVEGQNSAAVDLFDKDHARKVLTAFGRAFGKLPESTGEMSGEAKQFLSQAVSGLAQEGKVVSVRLALFAEMMKGRPWTPASLKEVGGTEGVGVTFLEETFSAATAPPEHRYHQRAARAVLKSLLPESGTDIKGHMRSHAELLETSGYASRPREFDDLVSILDAEIRLLTPTDPEGKEGEFPSPPPPPHPVARASPEFPSPGTPGEGRVRAYRAPTEENPSPQPSPGVPGEGGDKDGRPGNKYYQLTHDYLVPALRDWLTRKQKETRRGRAELLLTDRAGVWNARPENRQLPSLGQWLSIRLLTKKKGWTPPQRKMMGRARRFHVMRGAALALFLALATLTGLTVRKRVAEQQAAERRTDSEVVALANRLMNGDQGEFAAALPKLEEHADRAVPILLAEMGRNLSSASNMDKAILGKRQANAAVALLKMNQPAKAWLLLKHSHDPTARSYLIDRLGLLGADPKAVIQRLDEETDVGIRRALILSLGEFGEQQLGSDQRAALTTKLRDLYRTDPDPGIHAAAEWLLRSWKQDVSQKWSKEQEAEKLKDIAKTLTVGKANAPPQWYVNSQGQTMVVVPGPVVFLMGSPKETGYEDDERQHKTRIPRTFAIAAEAVTAAQYREFKKTDETGGGDLPVVDVSWYDAAAYCNWLSDQEGIPKNQWCYEIEDGVVTKMKANYLGLDGYRLPTEAEMEYATRAGASTSRYYGESEDLLSKYAWYSDNSQGKTWPVGSRKPNDLGLFDSLGNVWCWCQDKYGDYPNMTGDEAVDDKEGDLNVMKDDRRVLRGGSFYVEASFVRSAYRLGNVPADRDYNSGFRAARTLRLVPFTSLPPTAEGGRF
jgi:formylglycine-generating enzyme required for sulfatase activity